MTYPDFLRQDEGGELTAHLTTVAKLALRRRVTLLIGAGFSKAARGLPTGLDLAQQLLIDAYKCGEDTAASIALRYELSAIAQQYEDGVLTEGTQLREFLAKALETSKPLSRLEKDLATFASISNLRRIYTTNFDDLIGQALGPRGRKVEPTVTSIAAFEDLSREVDVTGIFHLNGDINDPKLTENQLREHRSPFFELLRHELLSNVLVMIGYSFRDGAITEVYDSIGDLLRRIGEARKNIIVMPITDPYEYRVAKTLWLKRCNLVLFPMDAATFTRALVVAMQEARYSDSIEGIGKILGRETTWVQDQLRPLRESYSDSLSPDDVAEIYKQLVSVRHV